ncbi:MAG: hypothetical protein V1800_08520, partial [Candidatus Latescibacterota bacterium]
RYRKSPQRSDVFLCSSFLSLFFSVLQCVSVFFRVQWLWPPVVPHGLFGARISFLLAAPDDPQIGQNRGDLVRVLNIHSYRETTEEKNLLNTEGHRRIRYRKSPQRSDVFLCSSFLSLFFSVLQCVSVFFRVQWLWPSVVPHDLL